jgi:uncharacterized protein with PIN domain
VSERLFLDASVLVRYLSEDDPPRALAAATLIDGEVTVIVSGIVLLETMHALRTSLGHENPALARALIRLITRENVDVVDADKAHLVAALQWSTAASARRIRMPSWRPQPSRPAATGLRPSMRHSARRPSRHVCSSARPPCLAEYGLETSFDPRPSCSPGRCGSTNRQRFVSAAAPATRLVATADIGRTLS